MRFLLHLPYFSPPGGLLTLKLRDELGLGGIELVSQLHLLRLQSLLHCGKLLFVAGLGIAQAVCRLGAGLGKLRFVLVSRLLQAPLRSVLKLAQLLGLAVNFARQFRRELESLGFERRPSRADLVVRLALCRLQGLVVGLGQTGDDRFVFTLECFGLLREASGFLGESVFDLLLLSDAGLQLSFGFRI